MKKRSTGGTGTWLGLFSFISIMLLGLGLFLGWLLNFFHLGGQIPQIIKQIAIGIALLIPAIYSFYEARRRGTVWFVLWIIAVILVAAFYILPILNI